jgi:glycosyltransferase involved in cell wall biosynthesis
MNILNPQQNTFAQEIAAAGSSDFRLPLVSVIIVNYNYGRFLNQAVDSVFGQTYPNMECIVVDNASTDESPEILDAIAARYPQTRIVHRTSNDGQSAASLDGFAAASGAYVIFMDADDLLLPQAAAAHMFAHLSLRVHVGFTSGDMLQSANDQIVVGTGEELNRYILSGKGRRKNLLRHYEHAFPPEWPPRGLAESLADRIHFVPHRTTRWVWSPTTGLCYRRDALRHFIDNPDLMGLRTGTDMYLAHAIGALHGSAIIDAPLFVYRIHGGNEFSRHPQLNRCKAFDESSNNNNDYGLRLLVDHLIAKIDRFYRLSRSPFDYVYALARLDRRDPNPNLPSWRQRSRAAGQLVDCSAEVAAAIGPWQTRALMLWFGVPLKLIVQTTHRSA